MRAQSDELQCVVVGFSVDKHQIRFEMAVPMIAPVSAQTVVMVTRLHRYIVRQRDQDRHELSIKCCPVLTLGFALVVSLELSRLLNRPHADRP